MSLKTRFCPKCGKETAQLIDNLCADCYFEATGIRLPQRASIQVCKRCNAIYWKGVWTKSDYKPEYYLTHALMDKVELPDESELESLKIKKFDKDGEVQVVINIGGKKFTQVLPVSLRITKMVCSDCNRQTSQTHVAVIQFRSETEPQKFSAKVLLMAEKYKSNLVKVEEQKKGVDIFLASKDDAKHLATELRKAFHLKMKATYEEYSWDQTKNRPKYRVNILLRKS